MHKQASYALKVIIAPNFDEICRCTQNPCFCYNIADFKLRLFLKTVFTKETKLKILSDLIQKN